jgi:hypothetical protein
VIVERQSDHQDERKEWRVAPRLCACADASCTARRTAKRLTAPRVELRLRVAGDRSPGAEAERDQHGTLSQLDVKEAGVGLAVAVLLDATVVRAVLLPASMKLLGDWNWYLPRWLDWLPRTSHEASTPRRDTPTGALAPATSD